MSFFKTRITELFGIKYPILQGGMGAGFVSTAELAAAVGNAGGLGFMSAIQWERDIELFEGDLDPNRALPEWPSELVAIAEQAYDHKGKPIPFDPDQGDLLEGLRPEPGSGIESVSIEAGGNVIELKQKGDQAKAG